jgi:isopenicillin N synthase-like dioxygenase
MTQDLKTVFHNLEMQFYAAVPFPLQQAVIDDTIQAFMRFLDEPDAIKEHIRFKLSSLHRRFEVGFFHRDPGDDIYNDSKDFFHYHPVLADKYGDFVAQHPAVQAFFAKAQPIWELTYQTVVKIMQQFEAEYPGVSDRIFKTKHPHVLLRFLKYNWQESGTYLAKPHFDAGSFTLAIAESCAGLRIGSCPEDLKLVTHQPGTALFMLSSNFKKLMDTDRLHAGWHDVIQLDETQIGKPFARWAIVAFIDAHDVEALSRTETHKWYAA